MARSFLLVVMLTAFAGPATAHAAGVPVALVEAETMQLPAGANVLGGKAVKMPADGALRTRVTLARRANSVKIRVRSLGCRNSWPAVSIQTAGAKTLMRRTKVTDSAWTTRSGRGFALAVGTHTILIKARMTRAAGDDRCKPVLYVDRLRFSGRKRALTVTPTGPSPYTQLVFGDEFGGAAGTQPDPARWNIKTGAPWNKGLNSYTKRPANVAMDGAGALDLTALRETYKGSDGVTRDYTSGAITTKDKFHFTYGRVEARLWVPAGRGFWSSFWTLHWPLGGELDAMEVLGQSGAKNFHTNLHSLKTDGSQYWFGQNYTAASSLASGFHVYGMTWEPNRLSWQLDGVQVRTVTPSDVPSNYVWGFKDPDWIILNLTVGGTWPLAPDSNTPFPSRIKADWVRVYQ